MKYSRKEKEPDEKMVVRVISNILIRKDKSMPDPWLEPKRKQRLLYIIRLQAHTPSSCPECGHELTYTEDTEIYCNHCGLVCADSIEYVAGIKINYPFGLRLG